MSQQAGLGTLEAEAAAISGHLFFASQDLDGHISLRCFSSLPFLVSPFAFFSLTLEYIWYVDIVICCAGPHNVLHSHLQISGMF